MPNFVDGCYFAVVYTGISYPGQFEESSFDGPLGDERVVF